jgi:hypothetical protein
MVRERFDYEQAKGSKAENFPIWRLHKSMKKANFGDSGGMRDAGCGMRDARLFLYQMKGF